jgi:hypothetical protein
MISGFKNGTYGTKALKSHKSQSLCHITVLKTSVWFYGLDRRLFSVLKTKKAVGMLAHPNGYLTHSLRMK